MTGLLRRKHNHNITIINKKEEEGAKAILIIALQNGSSLPGLDRGEKIITGAPGPRTAVPRLAS